MEWTIGFAPSYAPKWIWLDWIGFGFLFGWIGLIRLCNKIGFGVDNWICPQLCTKMDLVGLGFLFGWIVLDWAWAIELYFIGFGWIGTGGD